MVETYAHIYQSYTFYSLFWVSIENFRYHMELFITSPNLYTPHLAGLLDMTMPGWGARQVLAAAVEAGHAAGPVAAAARHAPQNTAEHVC